MESIFHRTSIRQYTEQEVESEKIEKMLRAAMAAPSAVNQQPWEYYVVTDVEKLEELSKTSPYAGCTKNAPLAERMQAVADVISIPDELKAFAVIPCGYPVKVEKQQDRYDEARVHFIG